MGNKDQRIIIGSCHIYNIVNLNNDGTTFNIEIKLILYKAHTDHTVLKCGEIYQQLEHKNHMERFQAKVRE